MAVVWHMPNHSNLFQRHKASPHIVWVWEQHYIIYYLHASYVVFVTITQIRQSLNGRDVKNCLWSLADIAFFIIIIIFFS